MNFKKKLFILLAILSQINYAGVGRYDIPWIDYEDFAMNSGKYKIGRKGIKVYRTDGTLSGEITQPMPNFDGVVNWGNFTLYSDPQLLGSVTHVGNQKNYDFLTRHLRKDVNLFKNYKDNPNAQFDNFSEKGNTPYYFTTGRDYSLGRLDKIIFDGITYETIDDWTKIGDNDLVARIGGGVNTAIQKDNTARGTAPYGNLAGGLNKLKGKRIAEVNGQKEEYIFSIDISANPKTAIDIGTNGGDSGSPLFWWDEANQKWKIVATNSRGSTRGEWGKFSVLISNIDVLNKIKEKMKASEITEANVTFNNGTLTIGSESRTFVDERIQGENKSTVSYHIPFSESEIPDELFKIKNQVFNKDGMTINLVGDTDTSVARLEFKDNATIQGNGSLKTAGFVIDEGKTLTYKANIGNDNIVRVIGKGTLSIEGTSQNEGEINIGQGNLVLNNSGGYAAKKIRVAQGATVKLGAANQLNGNNVYFGLRGGTLDLNSQDLIFNDIYHIDSGATIANNSTTKSNFEFNPNDTEERVFLGKFTGKLDVKYNPTSDDAKWDLRGDTDISGNLDIEKGKVSISGDNVVHGYRKEVGKDEFERVNFKSENINVKNSSSLTINRASEINSKISVGERASLNIDYLGNVNKERDKEKPYDGAPTEKAINDIVLKGEINLTQGSKFKVDSENDNEISIESKITGNIDLEKVGTGLLVIKNNANSMAGKIDIKNGKIKVQNENNLGTSSTNIDDIAVLEVENFNNFSGLLDKINTSSKGVLSLGKDVAGLDAKYNNYSNLFLGSSKKITIGGENTPIPAGLTTLNLGGDNGTVTLKGLDLSTGLTTLNIGNGKHDGTVIIDKIGANNNNLSINTNRVKLEIKNITTANKILNLGYGATVGYKNKNIVKDNAEGILLLGRSDTSSITNVGESYVGADKSNNRPITLTDVNTGDKYRFSGDGNLSLNMELENKEVIVDGQYLSGGVVEIAKENPNFNGKITIMGNKNGTNEGNITLKYTANYGGKFVPNPNGNPKEIFVPGINLYSLGGLNKNTYLIKDGGILEIGGNFDTTLNMKFDSANNEYGTIKNTARSAAILHIYAEEEETKVNNLLEGNFKLYKKGANKLEFTNENNKLKNGKFDKVDLVVEEGTLVYKKPDALNNVKMTLNNDNTTLEAHASNVKADIISNGGKIKLFDDGSNEKYIDYLEVTKDSNVNWDNDTKSNKRVVYKTLKVASEKLTIENQFFEIGNMLNKTAESELVLKNSSLRLQGRDNDKLIKNKIDKLTLDNSNLILRDFRRAEKEEKSNDADTDVVYEPTNIEVIGNSSIQNGSVELNDNGGGAMTIINNPITMSDESVVLSLKSDGGFPGQGLIVDSNISGNGKIELYTKNVVNDWNKTRLTIRNNFKDFTGTLESKIADNEMRFDINADEEENRTLNYKIIGAGQFVNHSTKDLIFKNIESFTGRIRGERGDVVLSGDKAINTSATIKLENDKNIVLRANENTNATNSNIKLDLKDSSKLIKDGNAKLELGSSLQATNVKNVEVKEGELSLTKDILTPSNTSKYNVLENATLTLNTGDTLWKSNIEGAGDIKQDGTKAKINNSAIKNSGKVIVTKELVLNRTTDNEEITANLKGENSSKLTLEKENTLTNGAFTLNKEISEFEGEINLKTSDLELNIENYNVNNKISGNSNLINKSTTDLTLNNLTTFNGKVIGENGNIVLNGENAITEGVKVELKNNKSVILNVDGEDKKINNNSISINSIGDNNTSKIVKKGSGTLNFGNNVSITNTKLTDVEEGTLKLSNDILTGADSKYTVNSGATLILNLPEGTNWETKVEGDGTVIQEGSNGKVRLSKDKNNGNIELNNDLTIIQDKENIAINSDIIGNKNVVLTLEKNDTLADNSTIEIAGNLNRFEGTFDLNGANLSLNKENLELGNKITGKSNLINNNATPLTLKELKGFTGKAIARKGDIALKDENAINSNAKVELENGHNLILDTTENIIVNNSFNVKEIDDNDENTNSKIVKKGNAKLTLTNSVQKMEIETFDIEAGELELEKDVLKDVENSKYTVKENSNISLNTGNELWSTNIEGAGDVKQLGNNIKVKNSAINNTGNFEVNSEVILVRTKEKENINPKFTGGQTTRIVFDKENNVNDNSYYVINNDISKFKGELKLNTTDVALNLENYKLENKLTGNHNIINKNATNLTLKELKEFNGKAIARNGNIVLEDENAVNTNVHVLLENDKHAILKSETDINVTENLKISASNSPRTSFMNVSVVDNNSKIIKEGTSKITLGNQVSTENIKSVEIKEGKLEIVKNILELENSKYDIKENAELILNYVKDGKIDASILGNGTLVQDGKYVVLNNVEEFNGDIVANKALELNIDKDINAEKITLNDGFVKFTNNSNKTISFENTTFENNGDNFFKKAGNSDVNITSNQLSNMKNVEVEEGILGLKDQHYDNKLDGNIKILENATLKVYDNMFLSNVNNSGNILLDNTSLNIENYKGNPNSKFEIKLNKLNANLLTLQNVNGVANANLDLSDDLISQIKNDKKELIVAKLKPKFNILNLNRYESIYSLKERKDGEDVIIYSTDTITVQKSNLLYILSNLNELSEMNNYLKFKNGITVNNVNLSKKDTEFNRTTQASYKNKLDTKGVELNGELAKKVGNIDVSLGFTLMDSRNKVESQVKENDEITLFDQSFDSLTFLSKVGAKYKDFGFETEYGYNDVNFRGKNFANIRFRKNRFTLSYRPEIKLSNNLKLIFDNNVSYVKNNIITEGITAMDEDISSIILKNPKYISYESGLKLESKYIDFALSGNYIRNYAEMTILNSIERAENMYIKNRKTNLKYMLAFKPMERLSIQFEGANSILKNRQITHLYKLGFAYSW